MKFSTQEVMDIPVEKAFALLTDFTALERAADRRGVAVRRLDDLHDPGAGMTWAIAYSIRGRRRDLTFEVVQYVPPHRVIAAFTSHGVQGEGHMELMALPAARTRMLLSLDMRPTTLPARLLIQSFKLTKPRLNQRYKQRVAQHVTTLEDRYRRSV